ncbi:hypothetical protein L198_05031 [Cryptococcus wingfieldii CBS 7118]|uniref:Type 1 phosphatases regulator n=1 Tax=Cryptococcus wingfieldii CBS 7118 TaxID=1295528 RepID=A0A1E3IZX1_9TREE|nr:hypothetical protein L198_05031 [Cryptococcus wingfieldii CBS 7118]ODN94180.1 hypothetical protein L198_05031 [Cryptococcus wingfieldii CBS 7118]
MSTRPRSPSSQGTTATVVEAGPSNSAQQPTQPPVGTLRLRGGPLQEKRVVWSKETVDNEGMGKKKSKICCIYHKPKAYDESSSESSSDDSSNEDERARNTGQQSQSRRIGDSGRVQDELSSESDGGAGDGRARPIRKARPRRHHKSHNHDCDHAHGTPEPNRYDIQPSGAKGRAKQ